MIIVVLGAAWLAWALILRLRSRQVWLGLLALDLGAIATHLALPAGTGLVRAVGGDMRAWALPLLIACVVLAYRRALVWARARARPVEAPPQPVFGAAEIDRYARHIVLREIGGPGQRRLKQARVLVVGAGGLGSPALLYLAAAGVGRITLMDDDHVALSNLQRQIIHSEARLGQGKAASAAAAMRGLNPHVDVEPIARRFGQGDAALVADHDLVLDGSDNFDTRYLVNRLCVAAERPLISAAITQWEGQISLYHPAAGGPCYQCLFPERPAPGLAPSCAEAGVVAPLPGVLGAMMALEAVKHLTGAGATLRGALLIYDGLWGETRRITAQRRPDCPVCGGVNPS